MTKFLLSFFSFGWLRWLDFLPPLLLRLFLAPLFWISGSQKLGLFTSDYVWYNPFSWVNQETVQATAESMSKLPLIGNFSDILPYAIGGLEVVGAFLLFIGLAVRWISLPLLALIGFSALIALNGQDIFGALKELLMTHGYNDISSTPFGRSVIYFLMLLTLFFMGAGRFFSVDWFLYRRLQKRIKAARLAKAKRDKDRDNAQIIPTLPEDPFDLDNTTDTRIA